MGYYYDDASDRSQREDKPPGCMDALIIIRVVFGVLLWPVLALLGTGVFVLVLFWTFTMHPALALLPLAVAVVAIWLFARWDQSRFRPPGL